MAAVLADRVEQVTTTTGTSDLSLGGVVQSRRSFEDVTNTGDTVIYVLEDANGLAWEVGLGTVVHGSPTVLQRTTVRQSSSAGSKISLTSGFHKVYLDVDAKWLTDVMGLSEEVHLIRQIEDLPDPVGDETILPAGKTVILLGDINLGSDAVRLSQGTILRGFGRESIVSSNTNGVLRATDLASNVILREFSIVATGGPCLDLVGPIDQQLNLFFLGLIGPVPGTSIGSVHGFDVQAFKDCFFKASNGLSLEGTTNKIFLSQCVFYDTLGGNAAITLAANLNAKRMDMVTNFLKGASDSIGIRGVPGYNVGLGRVKGTMSDGPTQILDGIAVSEDNWWFRSNDLIRNSRVAAQTYLTAPATTTITAINTYVNVTGAFEVTSLTERFIDDGSGSSLQYTGTNPVMVSFQATFTVDPANNNVLGFRLAKNGVGIPESMMTLQQGAGATAAPRFGLVSDLVELVAGDVLTLQVENQTNTDDVLWQSANYVIAAG